MAVSRSKSEERFTQIQKRDLAVKPDMDAAARLRADKTARLRQLRLAKEAEEAAEKQAAKDIKAAGKGAFKKRSSKV
jgi:colicin import membrane protein